MNERTDVVVPTPKPRPPSLLGFEVEHEPDNNRHMLIRDNWTIRPASPEEVILWAEWKRARADHQSACHYFWATYQAGTGKTLATFNGVDQAGPVEEVRTERNNLIKEVMRLQAIIDRGDLYNDSEGPEDNVETQN